MFVSECQIRVRYAETDQMGYVYYGNYATYFEVARVEALRQVGLTYKMFEDSGTMMPVVHLNCKYKKPAKYDDLLTIKTTIREMPSTRIFFYYEVYNEAKVLLHEGETTLVCIDMKSGRPVLCPEILATQLRPFFNS
jgi:acyl-CoA thioester hydrolase